MSRPSVGVKGKSEWYAAANDAVFPTTGKVLLTWIDFANVADAWATKTRDVSL